MRRTDLRDDEVDGHSATEEVLGSFGVGVEGTSSEVLELLDGAAAGKSKVGMVERCDEEGVPEKELFIG